eukprot:TRINITY_DN10263_c0_g1_i5.p1 TRINITY_DN10263_c0_g1~~TRINITY_DN10263_c0_g1_i5.p1  ORF type:complete len:682 (-),score=94.40 TRINITY_DN10263_c0_g1_i5:56-2080(-)
MAAMNGSFRTGSTHTTQTRVGSAFERLGKAAVRSSVPKALTKAISAGALGEYCAEAAGSTKRLSQEEIETSRMRIIALSDRKLSTRHQATAWAEVLVNDKRFDTVVGVIIAVNSIIIPYEQDLRMVGDTRKSQILDYVEFTFLLLYTIELLIRLRAFAWEAFQDNCVKFDALLVVIAFVEQCIFRPVADQSKSSSWGFVAVLRACRLLRLARSLRLLLRFKELWMLVRGLLNSFSTVVYTVVVLFVIIYISSCVARELINLSDMCNMESPAYHAEFHRLALEHFGSLPNTMLTLLQFATVDSVASIYKKFIRIEPWLAVYFCTVIVVISIVLMNMITAVIVNTALEQAMQDNDLRQVQETEKKKRFCRDLEGMFVRLDEDGSGSISREEILGIGPEDRKLLANVLSIGDPMDIFELLDVDCSGSVAIEEFIENIFLAANEDMSSVMRLRMEKKVDLLCESVNRLESRMKANLATNGFGASGQLRQTSVETTDRGVSESPRLPSVEPVGTTVLWMVNQMETVEKCLATALAQARDVVKCAMSEQDVLGVVRGCDVGDHSDTLARARDRFTKPSSVDTTSEVVSSMGHQNHVDEDDCSQAPSSASLDIPPPTLLEGTVVPSNAMCLGATAFDFGPRTHGPEPCMNAFNASSRSEWLRFDVVDDSISAPPPALCARL